MRTLARGRDLSFVPKLTNLFYEVAADLAAVADPRFFQYPVAWHEFRIKAEIIDALGVLRTADSKDFLRQYRAQSETNSRRWAPPQHEAATVAYMPHELSRMELDELLSHENLSIRGTALLECLKFPSLERSEVLAAKAPWATNLTSVRN